MSLERENGLQQADALTVMGAERREQQKHWYRHEMNEQKTRGRGELHAQEAAPERGSNCIALK